jgi:hypothetical protein
MKVEEHRKIKYNDDVRIWNIVGLIQVLIGLNN